MEIWTEQSQTAESDTVNIPAVSNTGRKKNKYNSVSTPMPSQERITIDLCLATEKTEETKRNQKI